MLLATSLGLAASQFAGATLIFGYYDFDGVQASSETADKKFYQFGVSLTKAAAGGDLLGSTDGKYGTNYSPNGNLPTDNGYLALSDTIDTIFTVTNNSPVSWILEEMRFDALAFAAQSPANAKSFTGTWAITSPASSGIVGTPFYFGTKFSPFTAYADNNAIPGQGSDYDDFDTYFNGNGIPTPGLELGAGQAIQFSFRAASGVNNLRFDNIALLGSAVPGIPEPGSLLALGCVLTSGLALRSRRRRPAQA